MPATEIQFLIELMLNHKLPAPIKDKLIARIGEVEQALTSSPYVANLGNKPNGSVVHVPLVGTISSNGITPTQAPSTQKILDQQAMETPAAPPRIVVPQEITTFKGNGTSTRGPRKF
jgi:hypothetical protein